jgi:hypothetical protein
MFMVLLGGFHFVSFAQNTSITNVDINYLKPNWSFQNLSVTHFSNGVPIFQANSIEEFDQIHKQKNTPAYIVFENEFGQREFYYNFYAVIDTNKLAPYGFKIPDISDFKNLWINKLNATEAGVGTRFICSGYVDNTSGVDTEDNRTYLWTNQLYKDDVEHGMAFVFNRDVAQVEAFNLPMYKQYGLSVRCIEDLLVSIEDSVFEYKKLLPLNYTSAIDKMLNITKEHVGMNNDFTIKLYGTVNCSKNGEILASITRIESPYDNINEEKIKFELNSNLSDLKTIPYYKGQILMAKSDIELGFKRITTDSDKDKIFDKSYVKNISESIDRNLLDEATYRGFLFSSKMVDMKIFDHFEIFKRENLTNISKFQAPRISNAFCCFLPGFGLSRVNRNANEFELTHNWKKLGKTFLISSISLGVVSISSKIYSNIYYNRYKNDMFGSYAESNYKKANFSQKIFLSSLGGYGLLGLLDFGFTFGIGVKNKTIERDLNKAIEKGGIITLK